MDRRAALKKLAAGGAIAMGGSMVLSSNAVAYAASVPDGVISGIPPKGQPLPVSIPPFTNSTGVLTITDPTQAALQRRRRASDLARLAHQRLRTQPRATAPSASSSARVVK
jgi:hypothetical protein